MQGIDQFVGSYRSQHDDCDYLIYEWSSVLGFVCRNKSDKKESVISDGSCKNAGQALEAILNYPIDGDSIPTIFVLKDVHGIIGDKSHPNPQIVRFLREIAYRFEVSKHNLILISPDFSVPSDLEKTIAVMEWPLPDTSELEEILRLTENNLVVGFKNTLNGNRDQIIQALRGLTEFEAISVLNSGIVANRELGDGVIPYIIKEKQQIIKKSGVLEYFDTSVTMQEVGGLKPLKNYAARKNAAFSTAAREFGLDSPRGVLLVGVPGTGKSLSAKAIAGMFRMPLLRMDVGALMGGLVGQSESNTRLALRTCEAVAPCVLWIDEIEKGLGGGTGEQDGGTSKRVLGTILTWMQERTSPVYIIATANGVASLQPELISRFNNTFFVDLPCQDDRIEILKVHLSKRKQDPEKYDLEEAAAALWGYSGREIETVVNTALETAFYEGVPLETSHLISAAGEIVPVLKSMPDKIDQIRSWAMLSQAIRASDPLEDKKPILKGNPVAYRKADV
jgi:AAA+ superfamily predicted ATPase